MQKAQGWGLGLQEPTVSLVEGDVQEIQSPLRGRRGEPDCRGEGAVDVQRGSRICCTASPKDQAIISVPQVTQRKGTTPQLQEILHLFRLLQEPTVSLVLG